MTYKTLIAFVCLPLIAVSSTRADEFVSVSARKAVDRYLAELEEIDRVAALRKAEAKQRLQRALRQEVLFETIGGERYHGMLGSYYNHDGRIPFIMLSVPENFNVLGENARGTFNAYHYDAAKPMYKFEAVGHVLIPRDGNYRLEGSRAASIQLNDCEYRLGAVAAGGPPIADVDLAQGIYKVTFSVGNNGGQMHYSSIRIIDNQSQSELPIFIYEKELENFRNDLSLGVKLQETSRWTREQNAIESDLPRPAAPRVKTVD